MYGYGSCPEDAHRPGERSRPAVGRAPDRVADPAADPATGPTRRSLLKLAMAAAVIPASGWVRVPGAAAATAAGTAAPAAALATTLPAAVSPTAPRPWLHAVGEPRGSGIARAVGRASEGKFGLMFQQLPAFEPADDLLRELGRSMVDPRDASPQNDPSDGDALDNPSISAGFTFLGQFVDHDMTLDLTPLSLQQSDPNAVKNFDTPFFDLASVYGRGPAKDPQLYDPARPGRLLLAQPNGIPDLPRRTDGSAILGDARNDENLIVAQLQVAFISLHNRFVDEGRGFAEAQRLTRWHFHRVIVNDFLPHVVGRETVDSLLGPGGTVRLEFYRPRNRLKPMMPVEYSAAAYRFGHSMVRPQYEMNDADIGPIFGPPGEDLRGSRPIPSRFLADWTYFYDIPGRPRPDGHNLARRIDTKLAIPLHALPPEVVPATPGPVVDDLAERNLLRGKRLGLPAGQDVARAMGVPVLANAELGLADAAWGGRAPLWYYVLKEAELRHEGQRLGPVGGRIVAEVILGVLALDTSSALRSPGAAAVPADLRMGELLQRAGVA